MDFQFQIYGPITDATWVRLQFYNPSSPDEYDFEKWFKKIRYTSDDLKSEKILIKPASQEEAKAVTNILGQIQEYIRTREYKQAWDLLSDSLKATQFPGNGIERFKEVVDSNMLADQGFLDLRIESVVEQNKVIRVNAKSENRTWAIDFIEENGRWKVSYADSYRGDWKKRLLPKMEKRITKHFDIYYVKDSTAEKQIDKIVQQREKGYSRICEFTAVDLDIRVCMVFFEDGKTKHTETGHQGLGWAFGRTIVEIYNEEQKLDPYHETTHILMNPVGNPPALFNEGFAVYMSERLGARGAEYLIGKPTTVYNRVRELKAKGDWVELHELLTYTEIGSSETRPPISYPEAGAFVKFLIDKYGKDKFLRAYKTLKNSNDKTIHQQNIETLKKIYGKSWAELEKEWEIAFR